VDGRVGVLVESAGAEQAAEKGLILCRTTEKCTSGTEARLIFLDFGTTLQLAEKLPQDTNPVSFVTRARLQSGRKWLKIKDGL
jgi:hypothetical protein